jgi:hypothetical protein
MLRTTTAEASVDYRCFTTRSAQSLLKRGAEEADHASSSAWTKATIAATVKTSASRERR